MDEHTAAVVIAAITGLFGFLGIVVTGWLATKKAKKVTDSNEVQAETLIGETRVPRADYFAAIRNDLKENGMVAREGIAELREAMLDLKLILRDHVAEDRLSQKELLSELRRLLD